MARFCEIAPLKKLPPFLEVFDYSIPATWQETLNIGQFVTIPWRGQTAIGLVIKLKENSQVKPIKELSGIFDFPPLTKNYLDFLDWFRKTYLISWPAALNTALPEIKKTKKTAERKFEPLIFPPVPQTAKILGEKIFNNAKTASTFWQNDLTLLSRHAIFAEISQRLLANNKSILILVPEQLSLEYLWPAYQQKFPAQAVMVTGKTAAGQLTAIWKRLANQEPLIILGTRRAIFLPLLKPGLIIVDQALNDSYQQWDLNPRYDARQLAEKIQTLTNCPLLLADSNPDFNYYQQIKEEKIQLVRSEKQQSPAIIVEMKDERSRKNFSLLSEVLQEKLAENLKAKEQTILFTSRSGAGQYIYCQDCNKNLTCSHCGFSLSEIKSFGKLQLLCRRCHSVSAEIKTCPFCHSVRLKSRGHGSQNWENEIKKKFSAAKILRWDRDSDFSLDQQKSTLKNWLAKNYDILIITKKFLGLPLLPVAQVAAVNTERLTNLANYNAKDETFHLLKELRNLSRSPIIIQTESTNDEQLPRLEIKDYAAVYRQELTWRQALQYPPFADYGQFFSPKNSSQHRQTAEKLYQILASDKNLQVFPPTIINAPFERWEITFKKPKNYFLTRPAEAVDWPLYLCR